MCKKSFVAALIMLQYKRITPIDKFPTKLYKDGIAVHVYNKNVIVRLGDNTKNHHLDQDLEKFEKFLESKTSNDYDWSDFSTEGIINGSTSNTFRKKGFKT